MTSYSAALLGIGDRGLVQVNMRADLLVFDPRAVHERASYPDPLQLADGFDVVIVNGRIARRNGSQAAGNFGRVLAPR